MAFRCVENINVKNDRINKKNERGICENAKQIESTQQNVMTHKVKYDANATLI